MTRRLFASLVGVFCFWAILAQKTYYVAPTGADTNPGTQAAPFKTPAKAETVVAPGDIVIMAAGSYGVATLGLTHSGTAVTGRTSDALGSPLFGTPDQGAVEYQGGNLPPPVTGKAYFVSPTGSDSNPGTIAAPFKTPQKGSSVLVAGDTLYLRAGTYKSGVSTGSSAWNITGKKGTATSPILIAAYPPDFPQGGRVVFDCGDFSRSQNFYGINVNGCSFLTIRGIRSTNVLQTIGTGAGSITGAWWILSNNDILIDNCEGDNSMAGFRLDATPNATFNNCDAHHIDDPFTGPPTGKHNNSDGFGRWNPDNGSTNTIYKGCRAWWCSDDGWDMFNSPGTVTLSNCWGFWNGYKPGSYPPVHVSGSETYGDGNGFKLGPGVAGLTRFIDHSIASSNYLDGFSQNDGLFTAQFFNNTSYKNERNDWKFGYHPPIAHQFRNNLSYKVKITGGLTTDATAWSPNDHNSWNSPGVTITDADFASLDDTQLAGPRKANGDLPDITFLRPVTTKLIDKGVNVGMAFSGSAPDFGALESGAGTTPPPVIYYNVAQSKSFQKNNCTSGTGSTVVYAVAAGKYSGSTQAAADQLATTDITNNGQNYANLNGTCNPRTIIKVVIYYSDGTTVTQQ